VLPFWARGNLGIIMVIGYSGFPKTVEFPTAVPSSAAV